GGGVAGGGDGRAGRQGIQKIDLALAAPRGARRTRAQPIRGDLYEARRRGLSAAGRRQDIVPISPHVHYRDSGGLTAPPGNSGALGRASRLDAISPLTPPATRPQI